MMQIGEVAQRTGFSPHTLRWYEKIGLIRLAQPGRGENNYRAYTPQTLERLLFIRQLKSFGFTLKEIAALLQMEDADAMHCGTVSGLMDDKIEAIERKMAELQQLRSRLSRARQRCTGNCREVLSDEHS